MFSASQNSPPILQKEEKGLFLRQFKSFPSSVSTNKITRSPPPHLSSEKINDERLQGSVQKVWEDLLEQIAAAEQQQWSIRLPYSQGLLFRDLLSNHPAIGSTKTEFGDKFTIFLAGENKPAPHLHSHKYAEFPKEDCLCKTSEIKDQKEDHYLPNLQAPNYIKKIAEISQKIFRAIKKKKKETKISAYGLDRIFLRTALHHFFSPNYLIGITEEKTDTEGTLRLFLEKNSTLDFLSRQIDRLNTLAEQADASSAFFSISPHTHSFQTRSKTPPLSKSPQQSESSSNKFEGETFTHNAVECKIEPHFELEREVSLNSTDSPSEFELDSTRVCENNNLTISRIDEQIQIDFHGVVPDSIQSKPWKQVWAEHQHLVQNQQKYTQRLMRDIVAYKCSLRKTSFELIDYLTEDDALHKTTKEEQMLRISLDEIKNSIYREQPIAHLQVNRKIILNKTTPHDKTPVSADFCFRTLIEALLNAQDKYSEETVEKLISHLFLQKKEPIHLHLDQEKIIIPMLQAVTFAFGANSYFFLNQLISRADYIIKHDTTEMPIFEFLVDPYGNCEVSRTDFFTIKKEKLQKGVMSLRLISVYSRETNCWSHRIKILSFEPSGLCSLHEQKKIYKHLV